MTTQDAKANGEFQVFYSTEILALKSKLKDEDDPWLKESYPSEENIQEIAKAAWEAGRVYGRKEGIA